jgi:hypothetical protein
MKKIFTVVNRAGILRSSCKTGVALLAIIGLTSAFWISSSPLAQAVQKTPDAMIMEGLQGTSIGQAGKSQLLNAVCKAVRKYKDDSAAIVRTATGARSEFKTQIWCEAMKCLRETRGMDCAGVANTVKKWIDEDSGNAAAITESISNCIGCREQLQALGQEGEGNFTNPPGNVNPPPGSVGSGAGQNTCIVCRNNNESTISCDQVDQFLKDHPGSNAGPCQATPVTNQ